MADENFQREMVLTLAKPIDGVIKDYPPVTELHLREPTAGELARAAGEANGYWGDIALISEMTKKPKSVIENLGAEDFARASSFLAAFARRGLGTGPSSPQI